MRIVKSLEDTLKCPNCNSLDMHWRRNKMDREYLFCSDCHEEIYENKYTTSAEEAQEHTFNIGKAPDDIDDSLMEIEYAVSDLTRYATSHHELEQMERIRDIFDELISVIRRMK